MEDCRKYNKNLIIVALSILSIPISNYLLDLPLVFFPIVIALGLCFYHIPPYFDCLQRNQDKKPPHAQDKTNGFYDGDIFGGGGD